ncbi:MAG: NUDIX hydrolase [Cytophagaceae bacterium]|nr:NUDIX hydrolase [Cytophagaceae bacterium]MDW8456217.1 NUDIX hydrolase [Cytophagaceae bacterium]
MNVSVRPSVLIMQENTLLLMRYCYSGKDLFQIPGGNMEAGETPEDTIERELYEEINIQVHTHQLLYIAQTVRAEKNKTVIHLIFSGSVVSGIPELNPQHTSALEAIWMPLQQIKNIHLYPDVRYALFEERGRNKITATRYLGRIEQHWL